MVKDRYFIMHKGIARWKLNNPFENWLSYKADKSELWKKIYVLYYKLFDRKYYLGGVKYIDKQLRLFEESWKGVDRDYIVRDMVYSLHRFGADFQDYWNYNFLNTSCIGRERFVVDKLRYGYDDILSTPQIVDLITDKYTCYQKFVKYYKRATVGCYDKSDFDTFYQFVSNHSNFIYKPLGGDCGKGVKKVSLKEEEAQVFFDNNIVSNAFIVEEIIEQHKEMAKIHPQSVNTVRIATFVLKNRVEILATSLRMGVGDSITDNAGSGGIFSSIDTNTGIVVCQACNYRGNKYVKHPDTNLVIPGFQIPAWDELMHTVKEAALTLENATLLSWDFAYSNKGWVIVEVNTGGDWIILQAAEQKGLKNKLYKLIDELKNVS